VHAVLGEIKGIIPFSFAVVLMRDEKRPGMVVLMDLYANGPVTLSKGAQYAVSEGCIVDQVCKQESSLVLEDTSVLTHEFERRLFVNKWSRSCVFAPLKIRGGVRGVLALAGKDVEEFYRAQSFVDWMAGGLSLAIERNNLSSMVLRRNQELDTIRQIGSALASSTFDLNQVLKYTMDMIRMVMNVDAGSLYLLEDDELRFAVSFNIAVEALQRVTLKLGQGIAGYVAARGESLIVNDTSSSRHFYPDVDRNTGFHTRSALCVPMISQGRVIGVIEVLNKLNGDFTTKDEDLLQSIAASVSIAIENSRLYRETVSMAENERGIRRVFQKFVPREILDKILHGEDADKTVLEEFKTLTLLNIDIRGFSSSSKQIGPQKTVAQLNRFFSAMGSIVIRYGGIVDKYLGDGFLALFGAPVSGTRDAENAVDAALEMQEKIVEFADFWGEDFGRPLEIGISIHTGEVVVGNIGFDRKMDYTVIGDAVNEVFRLQRMTKVHPNAVVLSESTRRAARSRLEVGELEVPEDLRPTFGDMPIYELLGKVGE
jgi:class 3 adenylate cyclase/putative methionine-R-sulfoxide reductase with GAF domain